VSVPQTGRTVQAHAEQLLEQASSTLGDVRQRVGGRLTKADRDELRRRLSGVIGTCEALRIWLENGAAR